MQLRPGARHGGDGVRAAAARKTGAHVGGRGAHPSIAADGVAGGVCGEAA